MPPEGSGLLLCRCRSQRLVQPGPGPSGSPGQGLLICAMPGLRAAVGVERRDCDKQRGSGARQRVAMGTGVALSVSGALAVVGSYASGVADGQAERPAAIETCAAAEQGGGAAAGVVRRLRRPVGWPSAATAERDWMSHRAPQLRSGRHDRVPHGPSGSAGAIRAGRSQSVKGHPGAPWPRGPARAASAADPRQGGEQAAATQLVAELRGQAMALLPPQTAQMAEQHQGPQRDRQADQQLQAELQHGDGCGAVARAAVTSAALPGRRMSV